jgi:hypothetical protein
VYFAGGAKPSFLALSGVVSLNATFLVFLNLVVVGWCCEEWGAAVWLLSSAIFRIGLGVECAPSFSVSWKKKYRLLMGWNARRDGGIRMSCMYGMFLKNGFDTSKNAGFCEYCCRCSVSRSQANKAMLLNLNFEVGVSIFFDCRKRVWVGDRGGCLR